MSRAATTFPFAVAGQADLLLRAHLNNGQSSKRNGSTHPLEGLVPGKVTLEQAQAIMDGDINPFKGDGTVPFSANYKKILQGRKQLPVYQKMKEFYDVFENNQIVVMEGQTGSGKTTQYVSVESTKHIS